MGARRLRSPDMQDAQSRLALPSHTVRWRGGWARLGPWRGTRDGVAQLSVGSDLPPSAAVVDRCIDLLRDSGYEHVVTSALSPADSLPFIDAGFGMRERLHLLAHDLVVLPPRRPGTRRAHRNDRGAVLRLDQLAFDDRWRFATPAALDDALRATPVTRFRVADAATGGRRRLAAYAVTGLAGRAGYLQRVAVDPAARGRGWGRAVVGDALHWLRKRSASRALVNTQLENEPALGLYEACGFRRLPAGLCVLERDL